VLDGFAVLARMKDDPKLRGIPVIIISAMNDLQSVVKGIEQGAEDYLPKPFHPKELIARIQTRLRAKAAEDDLREQREVLRRTFERFVAPEIVEQLLEDPTRVQLGGAETTVTVMFADLEGFTTVAQYTEPALMLDILNRYLSLLVHFIKSNGGTIDKFLGDGIMALYNTPLPQGDHALRAVRTALHIREALPDFHQQLPAAFRLGVNIGISTGWAIVGNVGTPDMMDFTAIGDTVNLASRLQGLSENSQITISEDTFKLVADEVVAERLEPRMVRGREDAVTTYLLQCMR
jgi:class 3 adenylate cyclase